MKKVLIVSIVAAILLSIQPPKKGQAKNIKSDDKISNAIKQTFYEMELTDEKQRELIEINKQLK